MQLKVSIDFYIAAKCSRTQCGNSLRTVCAQSGYSLSTVYEHSLDAGCLCLLACVRIGLKCECICDKAVSLCFVSAVYYSSTATATDSSGAPLLC